MRGRAGQMSSVSLAGVSGVQKSWRFSRLTQLSPTPSSHVKSHFVSRKGRTRLDTRGGSTARTSYKLAAFAFSCTTAATRCRSFAAKLWVRFVSHLFTCPDVLPPSTPPPTKPTSWLDHFIAHAFHHTWLHSPVTFSALYLLQRLKARFPAAKGSSD